MIFVTVGTQLGFDRLVRSVDAWAAAHPGDEFFAQVGPSNASSYVPQHMPHAPFVSPARADELMRAADLIVSHAGMGSILTALRYRRPILIMPRKASLGEHRNDHQLATARWLADRPGVCVAWTEADVAERLDARRNLTGGPGISEYASGPLVERLNAFIRNG